MPTASTPTTSVRRWSATEIGVLIATECAKTGADPLLMIAVADVESGLDNLAVGDGGTSFGLYMHHVGGAGGATKESARRYLDPHLSVPERCRALASCRTGADAAAVQRPANRADYARKVDERLTRLRKAAQALQTTSGASSGGTTGATGGGAIKQVIGPLDGPAADHMDHVHVAGHGKKNDPTRAWVRTRARAHRLSHTSGDRTTKLTANGNISDHWVGSTNSYADDFAGAMNNMIAFQTEMRALVGTVPSGASSGVPSRATLIIPGANLIAGALDGLNGAMSDALKGALGKGADAVAGAAGAAGTAAAGAIGDIVEEVRKVVVDAIEQLLKGSFRYGLIVLLVLIAGILIIGGTFRTFGIGKGGPL